MEKKNYAWPVTAINKEEYNLFSGWAKAYEEEIKNKTILIFGAGIRGAMIAEIFRDLNITNIVFSDNNPDKWGGFIDDYPIIPPEDAYINKEEFVFLVSAEENKEICRDLEERGFVLGDTYFALPNELYDRFMKEYERVTKDHILFLGDCMFEVVAFADKNKDSLSEIFQNRLGKERVKSLTMHGLSLPGFYHVIKGQTNKGIIPKTIVVQLNFETLTGKQHLLPRSQHSELFRRIVACTEDPDGELYDYMKLTETRLNNVQAEFFTTNKYKGGERSNRRGEISDIAAKTFFRMNYMYELDTTIESIEYLKRIIRMSKKYGFIIIPFISPINYIRGEGLFGKDVFENAISLNIKKIERIISEEQCDLLDLSHLCEIDEFADRSTPDETTNYVGRCHVADAICEEIKEKEKCLR